MHIPIRSYNFLRKTFTILALLTVSCIQGHGVSLEIATRDSLTRNGVAPTTRLEAMDKAAIALYDAIIKSDTAAVKETVATLRQLSEKNPTSADLHGLLWITGCWLESHGGAKTDDPAPPFATYIRKLFAGDDYALLKEFLQRGYGAGEFEPTDMAEHVARVEFLQDALMFNNPRRDTWGKTSQVMEMLDLQPGEQVLDIGSGLGYFTNRFATAVGAEGKVFAIDTSEAYIEKISEIMPGIGLDNVVPVKSEYDDIMVRDTQADVAFICSLYHVIYSWSKESERRGFLNSIQLALRDGGRFVIVENRNLRGNELNSCYVIPELVQAQLHFYGFTLEKTEPLSDTQFVMIFRKQAGELDPLVAGTEDGPKQMVEISSGQSLIHIGSLDSYDTTEAGIRVARLVYDAIIKNDPEIAKEASEEYAKIIPNENFGGEYTALQWFCEFLAAPPHERERMTQDPLVRSYVDFLSRDNYGALKDYLTFKYKLETEESKALAKEVKLDSSKRPARPGPEKAKNAHTPSQPTPPSGGPQKPSTAETLKSEGPSIARLEKDNPQDVREIGQTRRAALEDFILFNNPKRPEWEKTDDIMKLLRLKKGDRMADIGCGGGYYTYRFSKEVGREGRVFALDIKQDHLDFVGNFAKGIGVKNIVTVKSDVDDLQLDEKVDHAFMCSLYHIIYGVSSFSEREGFLTSIKKALRKGGVLTIVDNGPVQDNTLPYHGPHIAAELIIAQLAHHGFKLVERHQIIEQRYLLRFELE